MSPRQFLYFRFTAYAKRIYLSVCDWSHIEGLKLTDFTSVGLIDVLFDLDVYSSMVCEGLQKGKRGEPVTQDIIFGWGREGEMG